MPEDRERPQWAAAHAQVLEFEQGGVTYKLPPSVKARLDAPLSTRADLNQHFRLR